MGRKRSLLNRQCLHALGWGLKEFREIREFRERLARLWIEPKEFREFREFKERLARLWMGAKGI